jgi:hypothetical protein
VTQAPQTIPAVPDGLREAAEEIVDEADYAYHDLKMAIRQQADAWEKQLQISHVLTKTLGRWALGFAEKGASNLLRLAHKTVVAKDAAEFVQLQKEYIETSVRLCTEESAKLGQILMRTTVREADL